MRLMIVESPGKIKKLKSFLGPGWQVLASVGHVCDLPKKRMGIVIDQETVKLAFEINEDKRQAVETLKRVANDVEQIYLAMDPDREGEAIAYHVGMVLGKSHWNKIKRISFGEITSPAVLSALEVPRRVDLNLVHAQQARRVVDRLVGYRVSPLLWTQEKAGTSAGRVQSVAVRLVVEREQQIREFVPQEFWTIEAGLSKQTDGLEQFCAKLYRFDGKLVVSRIEEGKESSQMIIGSEIQADQIIEVVSPGPWCVDKKEQKLQKRKALPPFVTSSLQQTAHNQLKWSADRTMKVAQRLYERGLITYMRTDAPVIAEGALKQVRKFILESFGEDYLPKRSNVFKARDKRSQEAHECIRPTDVAQSPTVVREVSGEELQLYTLIWKHFVACQMSDAVYDVGVLHISAPRSQFQLKGRRLIFDGWTKLLGDSAKDVSSKEQEGAPLLPPIDKGDVLRLHETKKIKGFTKPPPRYSEARLIKALEALSIGRPSTYAAIIKNIKMRGYVSEEKRFFVATEIGERLVRFLLGYFESSFMDVQFTARMEHKLDQVAQGEQEWEGLVRAFNSDLNKRLGNDGVSRVRSEVAAKVKGVCPNCGKPLKPRDGRHGVFVGCTGYPECRYTRNLTSEET